MLSSSAVSSHGGGIPPEVPALSAVLNPRQAQPWRAGWWRTYNGVWQRDSVKGQGRELLPSFPRADTWYPQRPRSGGKVIPAASVSSRPPPLLCNYIHRFAFLCLQLH